MKKVAIILTNGFEEIEALATVDILRRASITCHIISLDDNVVEGCHDIIITADYVINDVDMNAYDMIVLPGGLPGADNLMNSSEVVDLTHNFASREDKYIAAICAAPQVLAKASVVFGKKVTSYPSQAYRDILKENGADYVDDGLVLVDGNIITSKGPATVFPFAYKLVEVLGGDSAALMESMLYNDLCDSIIKS